jgi:uncharacterized protein YdeI (YjbR/CyaY-like superfamily)
MHTHKTKVNAFLRDAKQWRQELGRLREIALSSGLTEEFKWRAPCYTHQGANVVILQGFKEYCALLFFKGALLKDPKRILIKHGEHQQSSRQVRFTDVREIVKLEPTLKSYIREAVAVERAGLNVEFKQTAEYKVPAEFQRTLKEDAALRKAFKALTPGRQRGYLLHFSQPKKSETRASRVARNIPRILKGRGLND